MKKQSVGTRYEKNNGVARPSVRGNLVLTKGGENVKEVLKLEKALFEKVAEKMVQTSSTPPGYATCE